MFEKFLTWVGRLIKRPTAWCMRCQQKAPVLDGSLVAQRTQKGTATRLVGRCPVCGAQISSFVKAA